MKGIFGDEGILFLWSMMSVESDDKVAEKVLRMLAELTVCGFSFAVSCLVIFKQMKKKAFQRFKGLCKELFTSKASKYFLSFYSFSEHHM